MKRTLALILALLLSLSLCACGSSPKSAASMDSAAPMYESAMEYPVVYEDSGFGYMNAKAESAPAAAMAESGAGSDVPEEDPQKIIYSANATVETIEFEATLEALETLIKNYGGWVESSSINNANYSSISRGRSYERSASYTIRIPSGKFNELMNGLSSLGNVPYTHTYTENVSADYYDVKARLTAYETQEKRMLEMMEIAETVEDILTIEDKLADLRYRMDSLQSSLNNWDRRVSYSTLSLEVQEVSVYTPEPETKISYGRELWLAFTDAVKGAGNFLKELLVIIVSLIPTIVILSVIFFIFRPLLKKLRAKAKARREAKAELRLKKREEKKSEEK